MVPLSQKNSLSSKIDLVWPLIVLAALIFFHEKILAIENRRLTFFIADVWLLNMPHTIVSFFVLSVYNKKYDILKMYKEQHDIVLVRRLAIVSTFFLLLSLSSVFFKENRLLALLNVFAYFVLSIDHTFQQSKGYLLKKTKTLHNSLGYINIKNILNVIRWTILISVPLVFLRNPIENTLTIMIPSKELLIILTILVFTLAAIYFKTIFFTLFSMRFVLVGISVFIEKARGLFHGIEYLLILNSTNIKKLYAQPSFNKLFKLHISIFVVFWICLVFIYYLNFTQKSNLFLDFAFSILRTIGIVHFMLDHYLFSQRYAPARIIASGL